MNGNPELLTAANAQIDPASIGAQPGETVALLVRQIPHATIIPYPIYLISYLISTPES